MTDWRERTLSETVDYIERRHHAFLREMLERLADLSSAARARELARRSLGEGGADAPALRTIQAVDGVLEPLSIELEHHLMTEESAVFPQIRAMEEGKGDGPLVVRHVIQHLSTEHEHALEALDKLRRLASDFTAPAGASDEVREFYDALREFDDDLREHIRLEGEVLFPGTLKDHNL